MGYERYLHGLGDATGPDQDPNCASGMPYDVYGNSCADYATPAEVAAATNVGPQALPGQTPGVPSGNYTSAQLTALDSLAKVIPSLAPGPSPRVRVSSLPYLTNSTMIAGLPNWAVGVLGVLAIGLIGKLGRR